MYHLCKSNQEAPAWCLSPDPPAPAAALPLVSPVVLAGDILPNSTGETFWHLIGAQFKVFYIGRLEVLNRKQDVPLLLHRSPPAPPPAAPPPTAAPPPGLPGGAGEENSTLASPLLGYTWRLLQVLILHFISFCYTYANTQIHFGTSTGTYLMTNVCTPLCQVCMSVCWFSVCDLHWLQHIAYCISTASKDHIDEVFFFRAKYPAMDCCSGRWHYFISSFTWRTIFTWHTILTWHTTSTTFPYLTILAPQGRPVWNFCKKRKFVPGSKIYLFNQIWKKFVPGRTVAVCRYLAQ